MKSVVLIMLVGAGALLILGGQPAWATILTVEVEGVVDGVWTKGDLVLDGSVTAGSTMSGYYTYDIDTPDQNPNDHTGEYELISISMNIGNYTFMHNPMSPELAIFEVSVYGHSYAAWSHDPSFDGTVYINGSPKTYDDVNWQNFGLRLMYLRDTDNNITDELPNSFPDISTFTSERSFGVGVDSPLGAPGFGMYGEITSLTVVPEPASAVLMIVGVTMLGLGRRKR